MNVKVADARGEIPGSSLGGFGDGVEYKSIVTGDIVELVKITFTNDSKKAVYDWTNKETGINKRFECDYDVFMKSFQKVEQHDVEGEGMDEKNWVAKGFSDGLRQAEIEFPHFKEIKEIVLGKKYKERGNEDGYVYVNGFYSDEGTEEVGYVDKESTNHIVSAKDFLRVFCESDYEEGTGKYPLVFKGYYKSLKTFNGFWEGEKVQVTIANGEHIGFKNQNGGKNNLPVTTFVKSFEYLKPAQYPEGTKLTPNGLFTIEEPSKPAHYDTAIDTIAFAKANFTPEQVEGFMRINAVKYIQRYDKKNGADDIRKAIVYLNMLLEHVEGEEG